MVWYVSSFSLHSTQKAWKSCMWEWPPLALSGSRPTARHQQELLSVLCPSLWSLNMFKRLSSAVRIMQFPKSTMRNIQRPRIWFAVSTNWPGMLRTLTRAARVSFFLMNPRRQGQSGWPTSSSSCAWAPVLAVLTDDPSRLCSRLKKMARYLVEGQWKSGSVHVLAVTEKLMKEHLSQWGVMLARKVRNIYANVLETEVYKILSAHESLF